MMNENNSNINLYAQLAIGAENHAKECRPSFSAGAVLDLDYKGRTQKRVFFFPRILEFTYEPGNGFKNLLRCDFKIEQILLKPIVFSLISYPYPTPWNPSALTGS